MPFVSVLTPKLSWIDAMEDLLELREKLSLSKVLETSDIGLPNSAKEMVELSQPLSRETVLSITQKVSMLSMPKHISLKTDHLPVTMQEKSM